MASKTEIIDAIEALAIHCRPPLMSIEQRDLWMRDWCEDLAQFPAEAILNACRKFRHSGAVKFPTAGQFMPLVKQAMPGEQHDRIEAWRPLTDEEYRALPLKEKIRHHEILAHEAGGKAGPMFLNTSHGLGGKISGRHLTAEEMPDTFRRWKQIEANHYAEARRLKEHLKLPAVAAE